MSDEIEKIFYKDVQSKKRTATGIHHMKGKRGYVGKMVTPIDFMSRKEKKKYMGNSEVKTTNMYDDINNIPTFKKLEERFKTDPEGTKKILTTIKNKYCMDDLAVYWGISRSTIMRHYDAMGVKFSGGKRKKNTVVNKQIKNLTLDDTVHTTASKEPKNLFEIKLYFDGLSGEEAADKIKNVVYTFDNNKKYDAKIIITEK